MSSLEKHIFRAFFTFGVLFAVAAFCYVLLEIFGDFVFCLSFSIVSFLLWKTLKD